MDEFFESLRTVFHRQVHIHRSRARGAEKRIRQAVENQDWLSLRYLLREIEGDPFPEDDPAHCYPRGLIHWGQNRREEASLLLDSATRYYAANGQYDYAALCQLEVADICQERGEFLSGLHALDRAKAYEKEWEVSQPLIRARLHLLESILAADIGRMKDGIAPAQEAQRLFHVNGDANAEFLSLMQLTNLSINLADFDSARSYLQLAQDCYRSGPVMARYEIRLGNSATHLHWYSGRLGDALTECNRLQSLCRRRQQMVQLVYAYVLEGNLHRASGDLDRSAGTYATAEEMAQSQELLTLQRLVWINRAWLRLLQGRLDEARRLLEAASHQAESWMQSALQVAIALLHRLAGHAAAAERALATARAFYAQAGDGLSVCAVDFHLAHMALATDHRSAARQQLDRALTWMEAQRVDYFPHWWHPAIVYRVLCFGQESLPEHAPLIHRIMREHLHEEPQGTDKRASGVLAPVGESVDRLLRPVEAEAVRGALTGLLSTGVLRVSSFPALCQALGEGERSQDRVFLLCAVFGLYVSNTPRKKIAARLKESEAVVRHAIRRIYERLAPEMLGLRSTNARKQGLVARAQEVGYVDLGLLG